MGSFFITFLFKPQFSIFLDLVFYSSDKLKTRIQNILIKFFNKYPLINVVFIDLFYFFSTLKFIKIFSMKVELYQKVRKCLMVFINI